MPRKVQRDKEALSRAGKRRGQRAAQTMREREDHLDLRAMSDDELHRRCKAALKDDPVAYRRYQEYLAGYTSQIGQMRSPHFSGL